MKRRLLSLLFFLLASCCALWAGEADTTLLREVVVSSNKENIPLRQQALSSTSFDSEDIRRHAMASVKDLSELVPGLFIPSYGSRLTTAVYLRGVGSRTGTPAVGLYMDGVPVVSPAAYDMNIADVERVEVLRGPQSTLYGRATMGGLIRVTTKDPLRYEGSDINLSAATYNTYRVSATHYHRLSPRFGFMGGVSYRHDGGFFVNQTLDRRADRGDDFQTRLRFVGRPSQSVRLDLTATYELSHEGAYPYAGIGGVEPSDSGRIAANRLPAYDRHILSLGLTAEHTWERVVLSNVAGFQFLRDEMDMDQDFTRADIYTLSQRQRSKTLSEEIVVKSRPHAWRHWQMTTGASASYQWLRTKAPVVFQSDGVAWLNQMIASSARLPEVQSGPMTMQFRLSDVIGGPALPFDGRFQTPTLSAALYHQSQLTDLFGLTGLAATLGLRLDYERVRLRYASGYAFTHRYALAGKLTSPFMERDISLVPEADYDVRRSLTGRLQDDYLQLLPKFSLQYTFHSGSMVYATVSRGYRSGGFNIQMFSEVLQSLMRGDIMRDVRDATLPVLQAQPMVPETTKEQVGAVLDRMAQSVEPDARQTCLYHPEYAWNYEAGTHLTFLDGRLEADAALFLARISHSQVSRMASSGLGRVTANVGRSRSVGLEASLRAQPLPALSLRAAYGFTHATLRDYPLSDGTNLRGRYVPFTPRHTLALGATYEWRLRRFIESVALSADYHAQGRTYWSEQNNASQPFYGTLDAALTLRHQALTLRLWGTNLTRKSYQAFYFETMGRAFCQKGAPLQVGVELAVHF